MTVNGSLIFVHNYLTFDQLNWMDYASFSMIGTVHLEITSLVSQPTVVTCNIRHGRVLVAKRTALLRGQFIQKRKTP